MDNVRLREHGLAGLGAGTLHARGWQFYFGGIELNCRGWGVPANVQVLREHVRFVFLLLLSCPFLAIFMVVDGRGWFEGCIDWIGVAHRGGLCKTGKYLLAKLW